jgi:hypothetical protein
VLGLRYVACKRCETVYATPDPPGDCAVCAGPLTELAAGSGAESYFAPEG